MPTAPKQHRARPATPRVRHDDRLPAHRRGYDATWQKFAETIRARDCWLCQACKRAGRITAANICDHIEPLHVAPHRRLDPANVEVLCASCHRIKTASDLRKHGSAQHPRR